MRVALFATCLVDGLFPDVGKATVALLRRLGHDVEFPLAQSCCGQMHINTGYPQHALPLIRNHVEAVAGFEAVVAPSGSCVGSIRHQHVSVAEQAGDAALAEAARETAARTYELSELLVDVLGVTDVGAYFPHRVTYHPTIPCGCFGWETVLTDCCARYGGSSSLTFRAPKGAAALGGPSR